MQSYYDNIECECDNTQLHYDNIICERNNTQSYCNYFKCICDIMHLCGE